MSRKPTSKRTRPKPKAVLRLPDLDQATSAVLNGLTSADAQRGYRPAFDEFVNGTAQNLGSLLTGLLYSVIEFISKAASSHQGQSIFTYELCDAWPMGPPTVGSLALIWLQASDE